MRLTFVVPATVTIEVPDVTLSGGQAPTPTEPPQTPPPPSSDWPSGAEEREIDNLYKSLSGDYTRPDAGEQASHRDELARGIPLAQILDSIRARWA